MTEHWLSIAAGVFLVGTMLYGHYRGLLRQCVSLGALILTIITVKIATPYVADFIKANPAEGKMQLILLLKYPDGSRLQKMQAFYRQHSVWLLKK